MPRRNLWPRSVTLRTRSEGQIERAFAVDELKNLHPERIASAARAGSEASQQADRVQSDARRREDARDSAPAGPGCGGFVVVVTPRSPVGQALRHSRSGDCLEIIVNGRDREWTVVALMLEQEPDEWPEHASNCAHQAGGGGPPGVAGLASDMEPRLNVGKMTRY